ncbi:MAG: hypothetical protein OEQ39_02375 [Gammaproteobacteria bacterium]|nr:hypothetical protein [Gammaproteobacteria bacterium]MDH3465852.1 hypothetical protein [Gammaproteobacteria bacterium]
MSAIVAPDDAMILDPLTLLGVLVVEPYFLPFIVVEITQGLFARAIRTV